MILTWQIIVVILLGQTLAYVSFIINPKIFNSIEFGRRLTCSDSVQSVQVIESNIAIDKTPKHFISNIIDDDIANNKNGGRVVTRFPPEPNGYLHLGHAKSICLNFGLSQIYKGKTHMRFDDTNPAKEDMEYVRSILADVKWLIKDDVEANPGPWDGEVRHASDYFQTCYDAAIFLIENGLAYVDDLTPGKSR